LKALWQRAEVEAEKTGFPATKVVPRRFNRAQVDSRLNHAWLVRWLWFELHEMALPTTETRPMFRDFLVEVVEVKGPVGLGAHT